MIIDKILDRYDGDAYDPEDFYRAMMSYEEGTDFPISRALDSGEEEDIKRELCAYIDDGNYNPKIKDFINSVKWLEADDGKDYSKEFDILGESKKGESKFKCSMAKKKESLAKKSEGFKTDWQMDVVNSLETIKDKYGLVVEYKEIEDGLNGVTDSYTVKIKRGPLSEIMAIVGPDYLNLFTEDVSRQYLSKDYDSTEALNKLVDAISEYVKKNDWTRESKKGESKKNESVYGTVRVDSEDIAIKVQESNVYPSSSGRSLSGDVPKVESWFSTLSEFSDCIDGMAEDCNGYPDISRDGSDIIVKINAPMEDENGEFNGDYEVIVELRCSTEITNGSLDGVVDLLNHE